MTTPNAPLPSDVKELFPGWSAVKLEYEDKYYILSIRVKWFPDALVKMWPAIFVHRRVLPCVKITAPRLCVWIIFHGAAYETSVHCTFFVSFYFGACTLYPGWSQAVREIPVKKTQNISDCLSQEMRGYFSDTRRFLDRSSMCASNENIQQIISCTNINDWWC